MPRREAPSRCLVIWGAARVAAIVRGIAVQRYVGVKHENKQASRRGALRHVLARLRRHGCCRPLRDRQRQGGFTLSDGFAANGYGDHSPAGYTMLAAIVIELLLTFFFLFVIHGVTDRRAPAWRRWPAALRSPSSISSASRWTSRR